MEGIEAYGAVAGEMYVEGEEGYQTPEQVLADLDSYVVKAAEQYASEQHLPWPPAARAWS